MKNKFFMCLIGVLIFTVFLSSCKVGTDYDWDERDIVMSEDITTIFGDKLHMNIETAEKPGDEMIKYAISIQDAKKVPDLYLPITSFFILYNQSEEVYDNLTDQVKPIICSNGVSVYKVGSSYMCVSGDFTAEIVDSWGAAPYSHTLHIELAVRGCNVLLKLGRLNYIKRFQNLAVPQDEKYLKYMQDLIIEWQKEVKQETVETWSEYNYTRTDITALIDENQTMLEDYALRWANGNWTEEELQTNISIGYEADDLMNWAKQFLTQGGQFSVLRKPLMQV